MLNLITKVHGLQLAILLHSETQNGKSLVDTNFSVAMIHVCSHVKITFRHTLKLLPQSIVLSEYEKHWLTWYIQTGNILT